MRIENRVILNPRVGVVHAQAAESCPPGCTPCWIITTGSTRSVMPQPREFRMRKKRKKGAQISGVVLSEGLANSTSAGTIVVYEIGCMLIL